MAKNKKKEKTDMHPNHLKDPVNILYEALFWVGLVILIVAHISKRPIAVIAGLIVIFLSLFVYELHHKEEEEKKRKGRALTKAFFVIITLAVIYFLYALKGELIGILKGPISQGWLLYLLGGLFLADLFFIGYHVMKKRKSSNKPKFIEIRLAKKTEKKEGKNLRAGNQTLLYILLFLIGIIIAVVALLYSNWITMILGFTLACLSLLAYRFIVRPQKTKSQDLEDMKKTKEFFSKMPISFKIAKNGAADKETEAKLKQIKEAERKLLEEGVKEKKTFKGLQKKRRQEEKLLRRQDKLKRKEMKITLRAERQKKKEEERQLKKLDKAKENLKRFEMKKESLKGKFKGEGSLLMGDITKIKQEVKKVGRYETDFDKLYELIGKYSVIRLSEVSEIFGISKEKAEEWAQILESHNLAVTHYPAIGGPELRKKEDKK